MADLELLDFDHADPADPADASLIPEEPRPETETSFSQKRNEEEEDEEEEEDIPELYLLSDDPLPSTSSCSSCSSSSSSVDYGFILAVSCLVTGISLVAISYTVPRDVRAAAGSVSAREMERLERDRARVGAHLDRCVMAGLSLLTLGGALLSSLLMVSMWRGERMRRTAFAFSKHPARLYGSIRDLRPGSSPEEDLEALS